jgi:hypothetical protein
MSKKVSLSKLRKILSVGAQFTAEFIGINARIAKPENVRTYRTVRKQNSKHMVSTIDSAIPGTEVWLNWKGISAEKNGEFIILTMNEVSPPEEFLKILPLDNREN